MLFSNNRFTEEVLIPRMVEWFNSMPEDQRTVKEMDVVIFKVVVATAPGTTEYEFIVNSESESDHVKVGEVSLIWTGPRGKNIYAYETYFHELSKTIAPRVPSIVKLSGNNVEEQVKPTNTYFLLAGREAADWFNMSTDLTLDAGRKLGAKIHNQMTRNSNIVPRPTHIGKGVVASIKDTVIFPFNEEGDINERTVVGEIQTYHPLLNNRRFQYHTNAYASNPVVFAGATNAYEVLSNTTYDIGTTIVTLGTAWSLQTNKLTVTYFNLSREREYDSYNPDEWEDYEYFEQDDNQLTLSDEFVPAQTHQYDRHLCVVSVSPNLELVTFAISTTQNRGYPDRYQTAVIPMWELLDTEFPDTARTVNQLNGETHSFNPLLLKWIDSENAPQDDNDTQYLVSYDYDHGKIVVYKTGYGDDGTLLEEWHSQYLETYDDDDTYQVEEILVSPDGYKVAVILLGQYSGQMRIARVELDESRMIQQIQNSADMDQNIGRLRQWLDNDHIVFCESNNGDLLFSKVNINTWEQSKMPAVPDFDEFWPETFSRVELPFDLIPNRLVDFEFEELALP